MRDYIPKKLVTDLIPSEPLKLWVATHVLTLPPELIAAHRKNLNSLLYRVFFGLKPCDGYDGYVTKYNAARADLIAELIPIVDEDERAITIGSEPEGDLSYWLCSHVLRFSDIEISVLSGVDINHIEDPGLGLVPLIKQCYRVLKRIKLERAILQQWHRNRHIMIRYFLDAVYHEL